jgi:hypothetical protein
MVIVDNNLRKMYEGVQSHHGLGTKLGNRCLRISSKAAEEATHEYH